MQTGKNLTQKLEELRKKINVMHGAERIFAFRSLVNIENGYYSPDELIDLSLKNGFKVDSPFCKIKRGTEIAKDVMIKNGSFIDGKNVVIGQETVLDNAHIIGSNIQIGKANNVSGPILAGNITMEDENYVRGLTGNNDGRLIIGNYNTIIEVNIDGSGKDEIRIGNHNILNKGLNLNASFPGQKLIIGNYNSLGRDGGGVISTSYRFNEKWSGPVLIGDHVETTRGAEILGYSLLGWPLDEEEEGQAKRLFPNYEIDFDELNVFFKNLSEKKWMPQPGKKTISFFGIVKSKLCCLTGIAKAKDGTRINSSYLHNIKIQERCNLYFALTDTDSKKEALRDGKQDIAIELIAITDKPLQNGLIGELNKNENIEFSSKTLKDNKDIAQITFPNKPRTDGYPVTARQYFEGTLKREIAISR